MLAQVSSPGDETLIGTLIHTTLLAEAHDQSMMMITEAEYVLPNQCIRGSRFASMDMATFLDTTVDCQLS
jgi:hypothetical protein